MMLGLIQTVPTPPGAPPEIQWVWWVIAALLVLGIALIVLLSKKREDVQVTNEKRATGAEALVKVRDTEIADLKRTNERVSAENIELVSENKILAGIKISELFKFWEQKTHIEEEMETLKSQLRQKSAALRKWESGEMK